MARFRSRTCFALFSLCILLIGLGWLYLRGQHGPELAPAASSPPAPSQTAPSRHLMPIEGHLTASSTTASADAEPALPQLDDTAAVVGDLPPLYVIRGTVWQQPEWDTWMENWMTRLEAAKSKEEFSLITEEDRPGRARLPAPEIVVTLQNDSVTRTAVTDAEGRFEIIAPGGEYDLFAERPARSFRTGEERVMRDRKQFVLHKTSSMDLELSTDLAVASVRGRVTDVDGRPIAGAKVTGIEDVYDPSSMHKPRTYSTVSDSDGFYELRHVEPTDFYRTGGYLATGSPGALAYVNIHVEAEGFVQGKESVPRAPIVTEDGLYWGRRFFRALARHSEEGLREKEDVSLPRIQGNTIVGIDAVLERVDD